LKKKVFLRGRKPGVTLLCVKCDLCLFVVLSRSYTAAAAAATAEMKLQTKLVTENQAEAGQEEVIGECQLQHGEILNGDIKIHYVECGKSDGDLVLLLHGFPNFWYVWKNQFQPLAEAGFHIIAPDMRGYNTSSKPTGVASYGRQPVLSDVVCIIDHFGAGKRAIVVSVASMCPFNFFS
jgi:hypothetical protein